MGWLIFFNVVAILLVFMFYFDGIGLLTDAISEHKKSANFRAEMERVFSAYTDDGAYEEVF